MQPTLIDQADAERVRAAANGDLIHVRPEPAALNPLALLQTAIERGVNPDQLGKLMEMQERWEAAQAAKQFAAAMTAFQADMPVVRKRRQAGKEGGSVNYKFANYEDVNETAGPVLARHGIVVTFVTEQQETGRLKIVCRLRVGTHVEETPFTIPIPDMRVNETQKFGAALSYGKRYAMCAALNIVVADEDPDAHGLFETVSGRELAELRKLAEERNVNVPAFMKVLKVASDELADIPRERFAHAVSLMKQKAVVQKPQPEVVK